MGATTNTLRRIRMIGGENRACARALLARFVTTAWEAASSIDEPVVNLFFKLFLISDSAFKSRIISPAVI